MRRKIIGIFVCILMIAAASLPVAGTISKKITLFDHTFENQTDMVFVPGEIIVKLKNDSTFSGYSLASVNEKSRVNAVEKIFPNAEGTLLDNIYLVHVPVDSDILSIVEEYSLYPDVVYAEPNWIGNLCSIPNDANFSSQWSLHNTGQVFLVRNRIMKISGTSDADIDAPEAWEIETGSPNVVIAIIDTGIDYTHPDLAANIWKNADEIPGNGIDDDQNGYIDDVRGWDFSLNNSDPKDEFGHGTMCAGVAAAVANNHIGIAGICWNCKLMPVKINLTIFTLKTASQGIKYAADNGADICSMSFGIPFSFSLKNAIDYAYEKGVFLCASAGNNNNDKKSYPAAYQHIVAVAATNQDDERCTRKDWGLGGSQYGEWVEIAAPGSFIYSTMPTYHVFMNDHRNHYTNRKYSQEYDWFSGTSSAAPAVAGVAALLLSVDPSLTPAEVKTLLCDNVDPYSGNHYLGTGRLNAYKALAALKSKTAIDIRGGLRVKAIIRNEGTVDLMNVTWQIQVNGGILGLKNKTFSGTVDIPSGKTVRVHTRLLFGFGDIIINVKAGIFEKTVTGKQRLIFTKIH